MYVPLLGTNLIGTEGKECLALVRIGGHHFIIRLFGFYRDINAIIMMTNAKHRVRVCENSGYVCIYILNRLRYVRRMIL